MALDRKQRHLGTRELVEKSKANASLQQQSGGTSTSTVGQAPHQEEKATRSRVERLLKRLRSRSRRAARSNTSWRVREGGGAMALMPWCDAARTALVGLVGRLPIGMGALSDTAAPLVQPSVTPSLAHNRPRMAQIGHAASSVPWTVLWLSAEQITNGMRSEDVAPVQTEAAWLCVDP